MLLRRIIVLAAVISMKLIAPATPLHAACSGRMLLLESILIRSITFVFLMYKLRYVSVTSRVARDYAGKPPAQACRDLYASCSRTVVRFCIRCSMHLAYP